MKNIHGAHSPHLSLAGTFRANGQPPPGTYCRPAMTSFAVSIRVSVDFDDSWKTQLVVGPHTIVRLQSKGFDVITNMSP